MDVCDTVDLHFTLELSEYIAMCNISYDLLLTAHKDGFKTPLLVNLLNLTSLLNIPYPYREIITA